MARSLPEAAPSASAPRHSLDVSDILGLAQPSDEVFGGEEGLDEVPLTSEEEEMLLKARRER